MCPTKILYLEIVAPVQEIATPLTNSTITTSQPSNLTTSEINFETSHSSGSVYNVVKKKPPTKRVFVKLEIPRVIVTHKYVDFFGVRQKE